MTLISIIIAFASLMITIIIFSFFIITQIEASSIRPIFEVLITVTIVIFFIVIFFFIIINYKMHLLELDYCISNKFNLALNFLKYKIHNSTHFLFLFLMFISEFFVFFILKFLIIKSYLIQLESTSFLL
jgi:hypothetical protein